MNDHCSNLSTPKLSSEGGRRYIQPKLNEMQAAILAFLERCGEHGATDSEIEHALALGDNARKRRGELCKEGFVSHSQRRRPKSNAYGQPSGPTLQTVWVATQHLLSSDAEPTQKDEYQAAIKELTRTLRAAKRLAKESSPKGDALFVAHGKVADSWAAYVEAFYGYHSSIGGSHVPF